MPDASHSQQDWLLNEQVLWRLKETLGNNGILSNFVPKPIGYSICVVLLNWCNIGLVITGTVIKRTPMCTNSLQQLKYEGEIEQYSCSNTSSQKNHLKEHLTTDIHWPTACFPFVGCSEVI